MSDYEFPFSLLIFPNNPRVSVFLNASSSYKHSCCSLHDIFIAIAQNQYVPKDENLTCCSFLGPNFWSLLDDIEEGQEHVKLRELAPFSWLASNNKTLYALRPPPFFPPPLI